MDTYEKENNIQADTAAYTDNSAGYHPAEKQKKPRTWLKVTALALCCTILGAAAGVGGTYIRDSALEKQRQANASVIYEGKRETKDINIAKTDTGSLMTAAEVYAQNVNSTVGIKTSVTTNYFGYQTTAAASGSGFILTSDGYILTNYHVIDSSNSVTVTLYDGTSYSAEIVGYDQSNDIAVLKVDAQDLVPVVLGSSATLNVGDSVVAIGNPLGELTFSLTGGMVSALNREVTLSSGVTMDLIQTDCAINSGNSGGALFNLYGEVVGITNAKYSSSGSEASIDNIGFAIPIDDVRGIIESIIEKGCIVKPYIGVSVMSVSGEAIGYGLPEGASVQDIVKDGPAAQAGLEQNDIITEANGQAVKSSSDLVDIIRACTPGQEISLKIYRQGETMELNLTVGEQVQSALEPAASQASAQQPSSNPGVYGFPWNFFG